MKLFSSNFQTLEKALGYSSLKHKTIAQNIANVDVPNYKAKDVSFKQVLTESTKPIMANRTDSRHFQFSISTGQLNVYTKKNTEYNHNGNNVDIDSEMSDMAANQIYYQALIERLNGKFSTLQNVIKGGR
ncbi:flagellar basal body rod protein FlgB [Lederbergia wuyishanensis]|uniref:Flagellar basal body rod protein FlgB n=1 Tax=Lederbergia wuyishanensis TaxID=1347903 RepID=A0ABU0CZQ3_9BACI|nr:flagellar basal body rod protein FlgB [Lederbergia wuyishanensis]MCJ8006258.1 flagellar basal body rod protein FlgB [Lederbergia wuyishanensis]MDQ0341627.1 flagellar basal-body rod protein FlgB [Lederbergia wuyishanensis]